MSSPVTWNPFTNNLDYVGTSATPPPSAVTSVTVTNGLQQNQTTGNVVISGIDASTTQRGVARFDPNFFSVTAGVVTLLQEKTGTGTTVGAATADLITIPLGSTPGTYQLEARVKAFESTGPSSAGYNIYATFKTDGSTATLVGDQPVFNEDPALADANAYFVASANNAVLQVLGVNALTINWSAETEVT